MLTGESQPIQKEVGDQVLASTVMLSGNILIEVEKAGASTLAAQIGEILNQTKNFKNEMLSWGQGIADKSARATIGLSALFLPFLGATTAVTVLNASFGIYMMALGPLSMLSFLNLAGHAGILVKDGRSLQLLTDIDTVVFDKTGTLTEDTPHVGQLHTLNGLSEDELLTVAAAAEYKQTHPIALAIREAARERELLLPEISSAHVEIGYGLKVSIANSQRSEGAVEGERDASLIRVGSGRFMELEGINIPLDIQQVAEVCQENGHSLVYVAINSKLAGAIELHATIRPEAREVINELRKRKMEMVIISGDHEQPTSQLAQELGIDSYFAETLPENTAHKRKEQGTLGKLRRKSVCSVGDGLFGDCAYHALWVQTSQRIRLVAWCVKRRHLALRLC
jgi:Cu2+-exporting ATPase